jgi:DNA-binding NtrC family response regulator
VIKWLASFGRIVWIRTIHAAAKRGRVLWQKSFWWMTRSSGHNLLRRIDSVQPEVVVLDIRLVDYDGLELLQDIRNRHRDLPVILCTAYDTYKYDQKSIAADYYVIKSFDLSELKLAIRKALEADASIRLTG